MNTRCALTLATALATCCGYAVADDSKEPDVKDSYVQQGFAIAPVPLDLRGKKHGFVGLGSYIVNTGGCNDCHTHPSYLPGHNPFQGQSEAINAARYLSGGRTFPPSPIVSANITPDGTGKPAGLTFEQFKETLRTGHNPLDPPGVLLQIMPWPVIGKRTDDDLRAIYEYLRAIPSLPDNPNPGPATCAGC